jgi:hypothetical protein
MKWNMRERERRKEK